MRVTQSKFTKNKPVIFFKYLEKKTFKNLLKNECLELEDLSKADLGPAHAPGFEKKGFVFVNFDCVT